MSKPSKLSKSHDEYMAEKFRSEPGYAVEYMNSILQDGDTEDFLIAIRQLALANGGISDLAAKTGFNRTQIYHTLSPQGNPGLDKVTCLLSALGLSLSVTNTGNSSECGIGQRGKVRELKSAKLAPQRFIANHVGVGV